MLRALQAGLGTPEEVANEAGLPLFRVRSGLRELTEAGLASQKGDKYGLSPKGVEVLGTSSA
jgi:DNA-binding IclR family transcriptional regulator